MEDYDLLRLNPLSIRKSLIVPEMVHLECGWEINIPSVNLGTIMKYPVENAREIHFWQMHLTVHDFEELRFKEKIHVV